MVIKTNFDQIAKSYPVFANQKTAKFSGKGNSQYSRIGVSPTDSFQRNSGTPDDDIIAVTYPRLYAKKYITPDVIDEAIYKNPNIRKILAEYGLPLEINMENATGIIDSHLVPVSQYAQKIYKGMGHTENEISYPKLIQAALLHDIGKVFIPPEILNKNGRLTPEERRRVESHNLLSHEILKTTGVSPAVAKFALEHHDYGNYERKETDENQALMAADIYSALREERPYKNPLSHKEALRVMHKMEAINPRCIKYLS